MSRIKRAIEKIQDVAGGVRGRREETGQEKESAAPNEARFDPAETRRQKEPGDDLPMPEKFRE